MNIKKELPLSTLSSYLLVSVMIITLLGYLAHLEPTALSMGEKYLKINLETTQSANAVTSVVTYFRGFDTLGEVTILFLSIFGVSLGIDRLELKRNMFSYRNFLLETGVKVLFPLILLFGIYVIIHGHLSPGGGFQGGVIIANGFLLLFLANGDDYQISHKISTLVESFSGAGIILFAALGVIVLGRFFDNFLPLGTIGTLFSGGTIPLIYIFVGLKVAAEITVLAEYFIKAKDV